jgi:hypothetical protein
MPSARAILDAKISEKALSQAIVDYARRHGWMAYRTFDSRRSAPGFPDLVLVHPGHPDWPVVIAELKLEGEEPSAMQRLWLESLAHRRIETRLWRPSDWSSGRIDELIR